MLVREIMTRPVLTVGPETPVPVAAALLSARRFTALPVVTADRRLLGVVTEADLLRGRIAHDPRHVPAVRAAGGDHPPRTVAEAMTAAAIATTAETDVADLVATMEQHGVRSVPVVEDGIVVGIVSRRDLLESLTRADVAIACDVGRALDDHAGARRWRAAVDAGVVTLSATAQGPATDDAEGHAVVELAAAVRGVVDVRMARPAGHAGPGLQTRLGETPTIGRTW